MKKNPYFLIAFAVVSCVLTALPSHLFAQTIFSDNSDIKASGLNLDKDLEAAMAKEEKNPSTPIPSVSAPSIQIPAVAEKRKVKEAPKPNLFAKTFFASPAKKSESIATDVQGFTVLHTPSRKMDSEYAVITDFGGEVVKTRYLKGLKTIDDVNDYVQKNLETAEDGNVEIRKMALPGQGGQTLFWVGDKAFTSLEESKKWISDVRQKAAAIGGNFDEMVNEAQTPVEIENEYVTQFDQGSISNQKKEEDMILKWADQMDIGEELWGPFHGDPAGEPILWQSFGETSYRSTNLEDNKFNSQTGYWSNRLVFRGIRFPLNTIDPFLEATTSMEAVPEDFKSYVDAFVGVEWRPLARNHWLENYRPVGNISILKWVRNYRFFVRYGDRRNIKDEIQSKDWDYQTGVQLFYEFGVDLPDLKKPAPESFPEYLEEYVWGEYFADYHWARTSFSTDKESRSITMGDSLLLGIKLPGIPLPENPINNEIVLMPYVRFNHTWSDNQSFSYQNYYFVSAGMRWMPFRTWRYKESEWLAKIKVFAEWIAMGKTQYVKTDSTETNELIRNDLRFGVSFASASAKVQIQFGVQVPSVERCCDADRLGGKCAYGADDI